MARPPIHKLDALTDEQRTFAEKHHGLIISYLTSNRLAIEDWYDVAALGYLKAVRLFNPSISKSFSSYAYLLMQSAVSNEWKNQFANKRNANIYSIEDEFVEPADSRSLEEEILGGITARLFLSKLSERQQKITALLLAGYGGFEIANIFHLHRTTIYKETRRIKEQLSKSLELREA